jgi:hypothetical protein
LDARTSDYITLEDNWWWSENGQFVYPANYPSRLTIRGDKIVYVGAEESTTPYPNWWGRGHPTVIHCPGDVLCGEYGFEDTPAINCPGDPHCPGADLWGGTKAFVCDLVGGECEPFPEDDGELLLPEFLEMEELDYDKYIDRLPDGTWEIYPPLGDHLDFYLHKCERYPGLAQYALRLNDSYWRVVVGEIAEVHQAELLDRSVEAMAQVQREEENRWSWEEWTLFSVAVGIVGAVTGGVVVWSLTGD